MTFYTRVVIYDNIFLSKDHIDKHRLNECGLFFHFNTSIALIRETGLLITDVQSALDLMANVRYETDCTRMIISKASICEEFFQLSTSGEILQRFVNYGMKLAIIGDYSHYTSKPLHDFIYESNHGNDVFFVSSSEEAVTLLSGTK